MELFGWLGVLLIIIIIVGALLGGRYLGDIIRKGCGCLVILLWILIFIAIANYVYDWKNSADSASGIEYGYFVVKEDCEIYTKPNIESEIAGYLQAGQELNIDNINKYNYFYEVKGTDGRKSYVLKGRLRRIIE